MLVDVPLSLCVYNVCITARWRYLIAQDIIIEGGGEEGVQSQILKKKYAKFIILKNSR